MAEGPTAERPAEPDFAAITSGEPIAYRDAENAWRASAATRAILGEPDSATAIDCYVWALPGRRLPVRAYRPASTGDGPLYVEPQAGAARAPDPRIPPHGPDCVSEKQCPPRPQE